MDNEIQVRQLEQQSANNLANKSSSLLETLKELEQLAEYVANSPTYNTGFIYKSEEGKNEVNKSEIITCMLLGQQMGFSPMESITMGKRLNQQSFIKVKIGKDLGLSPMNSLRHIYIISTSQGEIIYTGISAINSALTNAGVKRKIIEDGTKSVFLYFLIDKKTSKITDIEVEFDINRNICLNDGTPEIEIANALKAGKLPVMRIATKRATVELTRGEEVVRWSYNLIQATEAKLYKGTNSEGEVVKGKDNWNCHPATHLVKMCIANAGRIIASDALNGVYVDSELSIVKSELNNTLIEDAELITDNDN